MIPTTLHCMTNFVWFNHIDKDTLYRKFYMVVIETYIEKGDTIHINESVQILNSDITLKYVCHMCLFILTGSHDIITRLKGIRKV